VEDSTATLKIYFRENKQTVLPQKSSLQLFKNICLLITSDLLIFQQYLRQPVIQAASKLSGAHIILCGVALCGCSLLDSE